MQNISTTRSRYTNQVHSLPPMTSQGSSTHRASTPQVSFSVGRIGGVVGTVEKALFAVRVATQQGADL